MGTVPIKGHLSEHSGTQTCFFSAIITKGHLYTEHSGIQTCLVLRPTVSSSNLT